MHHPKLRLTVPWESIDLTAQNQIRDVLALPGLVRLAVMPDVHAGYGLCIGGVALMQDIVAPSFVGHDIGCGMCHVNLRLSAREVGLGKAKERERFFTRLQAVVPAGPNKKGSTPTDLTFKSESNDKSLDRNVGQFIHDQMATLGSGNHFLEIGENAQGQIGITIHSGSRRAGHDIAEWYMANAKTNLIPINSAVGKAYLADMAWAMDFALENRKRMLHATLSLIGFNDIEIDVFLSKVNLINETHNHAVRYGNDRILHRKGATPAEAGQMGVIPANQRDGVWITKGLGNADFLSSASHGAGRKMNRSQASKKGTVHDLKKLMKGVICRIDRDILDEAPWAYKQIDGILKAQNGILVDVVDHFAPIIVLKG